MKTFIARRDRSRTPRPGCRPRRRRRCARPCARCARRRSPGAQRDGRRRADLRDRAGRAAGREARMQDGKPAFEAGDARRATRLAKRIDLFERWAAVRAASSRPGRAFVKGLECRSTSRTTSTTTTSMPLRRPAERELPSVTDAAAHTGNAATASALTDSAHVAARGRERVGLLHVPPRAREGLVLEKGMRDKHGGLKKNPLGVALAAARSTRRSGRCTCCARAGRELDRRARTLVVIDNPMVPAHEYRICQRLHEEVHLPEARATSTSRRREQACSPASSGAAVGLRDLQGC